MSKQSFWTDEERQRAEATWLKSNDPEDLLRGSLAGLEEDRGIRFKRKLRLFGVACVRRISYLFKDERTCRWIDILEQNADGLITNEEQDRLGTTIVDPPNEDHYQGDDPEVSQVGCAWQSLGDVSDYDLKPFDANRAAGWARYAAYPNPGPFDLTDERRVLHDKHEAEVQVALLRDIFANPFRPVSFDPSWLAWNGGTVVKLAQGIYDERAFDRLPVLADALEEAGCDNIGILAHCRQPGEHVRGCWVVDLILGKG